MSNYELLVGLKSNMFLIITTLIEELLRTNSNIKLEKLSFLILVRKSKLEEIQGHL